MKHTTRFYLFLILLLGGGCLTTASIRASSFKPIVANYTPETYGAGLQNWALAQGENGEIYVGNNTGMLCFDGYSWLRYPMPGNRIVRSVLADGDRIYAGSYQEFGYFSRDSLGAMRYTSLWNGTEQAETHNDEIWNIVKVENCIYFQSFSSWFKYDGRQVTAHYDAAHLPLYFHQAHGHVYVQTMNGDFYLLEDDTYKLLIRRKELNDDSVVAVIPAAEGRLILCTEWNGLFDYDGRHLSPRPTAVDAELKKHQMNRAVLIPSDSTLVLGTIHNGIYAVDGKGCERWHYDTNNGLYNNSVLRLFCDRNHNVWVALDIGIALIRTGSPYSILTPDRNSLSFGMVYGVSTVSGRLYFATNQQAWLYTFANRSIVPIQGSEGQNWHISSFDSQILLGNNSGTKAVAGTTATNIPGTESSSTCLRPCVLNGQEVLLESSYYDFRIYRKEKGQWVFSHSVEGFRSPVREFEVDYSGNIWAAHMSLGVYKIELSKDLRRVERCTYIKSPAEGEEQSNMSLMHVMKIRGRVVLSDSRRTYTYDDINHRIVPFDRLNSILSSGVNAAVMVDNDLYWLTDHRGYTLIRYKNECFRVERFVPSSFFGPECNETNNSVYVDKQYTYFYLNNGIGRRDMRARGDTLPPLRHRLVIREVSSLSPDYLLRALPVSVSADEEVRVDGDITLRLSYPDFSAEPLRFRYRLTGGGLDLESESSEPVATYSNLDYGSYRFTATVQRTDGQVLSSAEYHFVKPRPFYLSAYAWALYILLAGLGIYAYARWHAARMLKRRNREIEQEKMEQEFKMLEQEHIIAQQRKQLLEAELQTKSKELASLALDAAMQQKAVESLKRVMEEQERKGGIDRHDRDAILKQFNSNMNEKEFWDIYHRNFDMIHRHFFRNLRKQYPALTASDLRFCALLRLNLSTKDIARFTNLTIRGVETARHRIRKKLAIPGNIGLVDFLIDFS